MPASHEPAVKGPNNHEVTLYGQNANDVGVAVASDDLGSAFGAYNSQAADDFAVPAHHTWMVRE